MAELKGEPHVLLSQAFLPPLELGHPCRLEGSPLHPAPPQGKAAAEVLTSPASKHDSYPLSSDGSAARQAADPSLSSGW